MRSHLRSVLGRLPLLRSASFRTAIRPLRRRLVQVGRRSAEAAGVDRWSHPALYEMDRRLLERLGPGGTFVEAGANDGFNQSNTYWLERFHGWRGVLIEPVPDLARLAATERPRATVVNRALVSDASTTSVTIRYAGLMSLVPGARGSQEADDAWVADGLNFAEDAYETDVPASTLSAVLDELGRDRPDLLSLDVEGYEPDVLRGIDARHAPRHLLVEVRDADARARVDEVVADRYDFVEMLSPYDAWYRLRTQ